MCSSDLAEVLDEARDVLLRPFVGRRRTSQACHGTLTAGVPSHYKQLRIFTSRENWLDVHARHLSMPHLINTIRRNIDAVNSLIRPDERRDGQECRSG